MTTPDSTPGPAPATGPSPQEREVLASISAVETGQAGPPDTATPDAEVDVAGDGDGEGDPAPHPQPHPVDPAPAPARAGAPTVRALVVVDVQPTFCEGGALAVDGGDDVAERVALHAARHRDSYAAVVTTQDWHIEPGAHFSSTPDLVDSWPPHGVAGTDEAELHPALADLAPDISVKKGRYAAAYSGFEGVDVAGRPLVDLLAARGVTDVDVVGIAESHCVLQTALDAVAAGLGTRVLTDLTVPVTPEAGAAAREQMRAAGVVLERSTGAAGT